MPPSGWIDDLQAAPPSTGAAGSVWLSNLNAAHPWRAVVGDIVLPDGRRAVLNYHTDVADLSREEEAARLLAEPGAPAAAPASLGADEARRVIVFARLTGPDLHTVLDTPEAWTAWRAAVRLVAEVHLWSSRFPATPAPVPSTGLRPARRCPSSTVPTHPRRQSGTGRGGSLRTATSTFRPLPLTMLETTEQRRAL